MIAQAGWHAGGKWLWVAIGWSLLAWKGVPQEQPPPQDKDNVKIVANDIVVRPVLAKDASDPEKNRVVIKYKWEVDPARHDVKRTCRVQVEFAEAQIVGTTWRPKELPCPCQPLTNQRVPEIVEDTKNNAFHAPNALFEGNKLLSVTLERIDPINKMIWRIKRVYRVVNGEVQTDADHSLRDSPSLIIFPPEGNRVSGETDAGCIVTYTLTCPGLPTGASIPVTVDPQGRFVIDHGPLTTRCLLCVTSVNSFGGSTTVCIVVKPT